MARTLLQRLIFAIIASLLACAAPCAASEIDTQKKQEIANPAAANAQAKSAESNSDPKSKNQQEGAKQVPSETAKRIDSIGAAAATAARVVTGMKSAEERLARKETGDETRKVQKQVIDDLEALIDAASRMQQRQQKQQQRQQSKEPQNADSQKNEKQQRNEGDSGAGDENRRKDDQGVDPTEAKGESAKKDAAADRHRKLLGEVWGHLPESLRQRLLNDLGEKTLPGYDDLVRRYFEALAEPPKTGSNSSEKKIK